MEEATGGRTAQRRWPNRRRRRGHQEEEDDGLVGRVGRVAEKPPGMVQGFQAGRAQWAEMGQQAGRTGRYGGLHYEKSKERLTSGLPRIPGQTDFGPLGRIEKKFLDFDSRNEIQI
jgi:hypothetical protein